MIRSRFRFESAIAFDVYWRFAGLIFCLAFFATTTEAAKLRSGSTTVPMVLAEGGHTRYVIALADDAIPSEIKAANELAAYLHNVTGAAFKIFPESKVSPRAPQILVGAGSRVRRLMPRHAWKALSADSIVLQTVGNKLVLAGGRPRGTLYAVYQFLEEVVGVRWWTPKESTVPHKPELRLPTLNIAYTPQFSYREHYTTSVMRDRLFATRFRENGHHQLQGEDLGDHYSIIGFVHTFDQLLPPEKYFKEHPEWYSDPDNDGLPSTAQSKLPAPQTSQLCLTNEEMRRELTRVALEWIRKNPSAGMISISQNDNRSRCKSAADLALEEMEGSPAGPLLHFVNAVATEIEKEFPGFMVETLAYTYTRKPPRHVRPRDNVIIRLCSFEADFSRPFDHEANRSFFADLSGWKSIAPNLFVWDYVTNFSNEIWPHPNLRVLGPNLRVLAANHVRGVFLQGDADTNGAGDFVHLRAWLISHLMWNPHQDENSLVSEFLHGYYGAAAPYLKEYLDLINDAFQPLGRRLSLYQHNHSYLTLEVMNRATRLFNEAELAVAEDPLLSWRVRRERLALDHVWIRRYQTYQRAAQGTGRDFEGPKDKGDAVEEFVRAAEAFGIEKYREDDTFSNYRIKLLGHKESAATLPIALQGAPAGENGKDTIDIQEDALRYSGMGTYVNLVADSAASDGSAARMVGAKNKSAGQYDLDDDPIFLERGLWDCYIVVRAKPTADADKDAQATIAFSYGIYDPVSKLTVTQRDVPLSEIGGDDYRVLSLGHYPLNSAMYVYVAPAENPKVEGVYLDRILLIREKSVSAQR